MLIEKWESNRHKKGLKNSTDKLGRGKGRKETKGNKVLEK